MSDITYEFEKIKSHENELQSLIEMCGKAELSHGVRLLSMYVALYKKSYGELPRDSYEKILSSSVVDAELAKVFESGMREAVSILDMILRSHVQQTYPTAEAVTLN